MFQRFVADDAIMLIAAPVRSIAAPGTRRRRVASAKLVLLIVSSLMPAAASDEASAFAGVPTAASDLFGLSPPLGSLGGGVIPTLCSPGSAQPGADSRDVLGGNSVFASPAAHGTPTQPAGPTALGSWAGSSILAPDPGAEGAGAGLASQSPAREAGGGKYSGAGIGELGLLREGLEAPPSPFIESDDSCITKVGVSPCRRPCAALAREGTPRALLSPRPCLRRRRRA